MTFILQNGSETEMYQQPDLWGDFRLSGSRIQPNGNHWIVEALLVCGSVFAFMCFPQVLVMPVFLKHADACLSQLAVYLAGSK